MRKETDNFARSDIFEGMVSFRALIKGGKREIKKVLVSNERTASRKKELSYIIAMSHEKGFGVEFVSEEEINALALGNSHGGIITLCGERTIPPLDKSDIKENGFYMQIEGIEDPYNFGYALRSLYAAGVDGIILSPRNWLEAAGVVCRASAGASELFDIYISSGEDAARAFKNKGYLVAAADTRESKSLYDCELKKPLFLIVGGEKRGISRSLLSLCDKTVKIDYARDCGYSLSAASAATVMAFEIMRINRKL